MTGGSPEATGTPRSAGERSLDTPVAAGAFIPPEAVDVATAPAAEASAAGGSAVDVTRFAHASEAEMARILDFYAVRWEYEPTTFPILWNLDGAVVESFAPDFYLPELEVFLEMTTLKQRLVRKKNRKLRRLRELYPDIRIKLFYARDFRAMMLKYGRLGLAESLSGTPGQVVPERAAAVSPLAAIASLDDTGPVAIAAPPLVTGLPLAIELPIVGAEPAPARADRSVVPSVPRATPRTRSGRRRRRPRVTTEPGPEREAGG